jgi:hypothetical protein
MKKSFTLSANYLLKAKFTAVLLFAFFGLSAQSVIISYEYASLGTACNVFASPVTHDGYVHKTNIGFPNYAANPVDAIILETTNHTTDYHKVEQYSIAYPFKAGYSYTVKVYGSSTIGTYHPTIGLSISQTDGGSNTSTTCNGPQDFPVSGKSTYAQSTLGGSWAWSNAIINNVTMDDNYGYLLVAAFPSVGMTGTQNVKVRKIQIIESDPPFTMSVSNIPVTCGSSKSESFWVFNPNNVQNITGYTWNLGPNNGWVYNGSAAPSSFTTTTNNIQLSTTCATSSLSNVSVTVYVGSQANTTLTATTNYTTALPSSFQFNGQGFACTQSPVAENYSLYDEPCNSAVTWSASPSGMVTLSAVGNTVNVTPVTNASGTVTLTANITNSCNVSGSYTKTINLDNSGCLCLPGATGLYDGPGNYGSGTRKLYWTMQQGVGNYTIDYTYAGGGGSATGSSPYDFYHQPGATFSWRVRGHCSNGFTALSNWSTFVMPRAIFDDGGATEVDPSGYKLTVYPNPASKRLNVSFGADANGRAAVVITDLLGKTVKTLNLGVQKGLNLHGIDVSGMVQGIYFLRITRDGKAVTRKVLIQK